MCSASYGVTFKKGPLQKTLLKDDTIFRRLTKRVTLTYVDGFFSFELTLVKLG